jgi:uncharacterized protein (TIGR02118 family)
MASVTTTANITVLYPKTTVDDESFDMDYYVTKHMPLVMKIWGPKGLTGWQVIGFEADDATSQYLAGSIFSFENSATARKVLEIPESAALFEDIPNFTNIKPVVMKGNVTSSWSKA